jgi:hypothetical protein
MTGDDPWPLLDLAVLLLLTGAGLRAASGRFADVR